MDKHEPVVLSAPVGVGRLDAWLAEQLPVSRSRLKSMILAGEVRVNGKAARPSTRLVGGEEVWVPAPAPPTTTLEAQDIPVEVLHLDEDVLVVDKPAGMVVHPAPGHPDGTLVNAVLHLLEAVHQEGEPGLTGERLRPGIVHRLDRGTSGVMVVARNPEAHAHLAAQFAAHTTERRYWALVHGEMKEQGTVDAALGRHSKDRKRFAVVENGKHAITHWSRLAVGRHGIPGDAQGGRVSLVECRLETGRTHQIRVHLTHLGYPIVGDPLYGSRHRLPGAVLSQSGPVEHQLLHARLLSFEHPGSGKRMRFTTSLPSDFQAVMTAVGLQQWIPAATE